MNRKRVHAAGKFGGQNCIDHPVPVDPTLSAERIGHDGDTEMSLAAGAVAGVTGVLRGLIDNVEALRGEGRGQFFRDEVLRIHDARSYKTSD
jgi:hypothetical protein